MSFILCPPQVIRMAARRSCGPSGSHPWLLGGSEDPWLSVPVFRRVWLCRYLLCPERITGTSPLQFNTAVILRRGVPILADCNVRFGSLADLLTKCSLMSAFGRKAVVYEPKTSIKIRDLLGQTLNVRFHR